ncbi:MAG: OmpA family protein [Chitinophagaceae bacterium]|nr:MAG: OmpA family protein [Chitinophagaceae bacterium]
MLSTLLRPFYLMSLMLFTNMVFSQTPLLLNGGFEDINTCVEYNSECGVEGWFYLKEVKAQMLNYETESPLLGKNSYLIYSDWKNDPGFTPVIGALLPCRLQPGHQYIFRGMISVKLNPKLEFRPAVSFSPKYYVPRRKFALGFVADSITRMEQVPGSGFYRFEYNYTAKGNEDYLTFGSFVSEDTVAGKQKLTGVQTIAITLDNFELIPVDPAEGPCDGYGQMKNAIYAYDYRHKEMDYPLYGNGELKIRLPDDASVRLTRERPAPVAKNVASDTLRLGDLSFDFNKAVLRDSTRARLASYFSGTTRQADSITIEGHTDSIGKDAFNLELSRNRCLSVQNWLTGHQVSVAGSIRIAPYGRSRPEATNTTAGGRAQNRRVELIIYWKKTSE